VNAHRQPYAFYLYPKLEEADRVECRFGTEMLGDGRGSSEETVKVEGRGTSARGDYPCEWTSEQRRGLWRGILRSCAPTSASSLCLPKGMTASDYLERNRQAAGLAD